MPTTLMKYRGYAVCVRGEGSSWSYSASPSKPDLPILSQSDVSAGLNEAQALSDAKQRIDLLLR